MTIALTYNNDLSRVQITLSGLIVDTVRIEWSTNQLFWQTVRGGTELPVIAGAASLDDFEFAADVQNFYRVLDVVDDSVEESDSITPVFGDCEIWLKSIRYNLLNQQIDIADYSDLDRPGRTGIFEVTGRSFPVGVTDVNTSVRYELVLNTETADEQRKLSLALALGDILFLHVPPNTNPRFPPRSIYFVPSSAQVERVGLEERRRTYVPLTEVAAPSPFVVGTTLTWANVFATFGDWTSLINANPSWFDLLATVGSPEDLVVI